MDRFINFANLNELFVL